MTNRFRQCICAVVGTTLLVMGSACTTKSLDVEASAPTTDAPTTVTERQGTTSSTTTSVPPSTTTVPPAPPTVESAEGAIGAPGSRAGQCPTEATVEELDEVFGSADVPPADAMNAVLDLLAMYVPPQLASDYQITRDAMLQLIAAFESLGPGADPSTMSLEQMEQFLADLEAMNQPEVAAASERIGEYFSEICPDMEWYGEGFDPFGSAFD